MEHSLPLISTLAIAFGMALVFGYAAEKMRMPALVGYLVAGVMCGANTPGPTADPALAAQLSELGIILLMFGVGLHFSVEDLMRVGKTVIPCAVIQMVFTSSIGMAFSILVWDWSLSAALIFGLSLSCASTVVVLKALEMDNTLRTTEGSLAVGWLIVEDLITVFVLVLLPVVAVIVGESAGAEKLSAGMIAWEVAKTIGNVLCFGALMFFVGKTVIPRMLMKVASLGSRELFTVFLLATSIGIAYVATHLFHVSVALGAFVAGTVLRESRYARRAAEENMPFQDAFSVLFFVGIGMLLEWRIFITDFDAVLCVIGVILVGHTFCSFTLLHLGGKPLHVSMRVAALLTQVGEFSFILVAEGMARGMVEANFMSLIVAASIVSIVLNQVVLGVVPVTKRVLLRHFSWARSAAMRTDEFAALPHDTNRRVLRGQTIVAGSGLMSDLLRSRLSAAGLPVIAVTNDVAHAKELRDAGVAVVVGDISDPMVLVQAHVASARVLVLADKDRVRVEQAVKMAKELNNTIDVFVRTDTEVETLTFRNSGIADAGNDRELASGAIVERVLGFYDAYEKKLSQQE